MIQIRNNTFETNSSSAHTVAIKNHDEYDYSLKWLLNENGVFDFWCTSDLDFGRSPFDVLCTTCDKIPYFIAKLLSIIPTSSVLLLNILLFRANFSTVFK